jgi:hypothetical protein
MFKDQLQNVLEAWLVVEPFDEWLFEAFRNNHVKTMDSITAFNSINDAVKVLLDQSDESALIEIVETLLCLAKASHTTEVPSVLGSSKADLEALFSAHGTYANQKLRDLFRYYKL